MSAIGVIRLSSRALPLPSASAYRSGRTPTSPAIRCAGSIGAITGDPTGGRVIPCCAKASGIGVPATAAAITAPTITVAGCGLSAGSVSPSGAPSPSRRSDSPRSSGLSGLSPRRSARAPMSPNPPVVGNALPAAGAPPQDGTEPSGVFTAGVVIAAGDAGVSAAAGAAVGASLTGSSGIPRLPSGSAGSESGRLCTGSCPGVAFAYSDASAAERAALEVASSSAVSTTARMSRSRLSR